MNELIEQLSKLDSTAQIFAIIALGAVACLGIYSYFKFGNDILGVTN